MKAAVMHRVGTQLAIEDRPTPRIGPHEVLIQTKTCGICGTDLHILDGHGYVPQLPHILGHEPAGVVAEIGSEVTGLKPGDRVVPHLFITCNQCYFCRTGRQQQCANLSGIIGVLVDGAFAEYFKAPAANFFRLPDTIPFDMGGLAADAVVTSVHAFRRSGLTIAESAAIIGAGGIGQVLVQILKHAGVHVLALSRSRVKLDIAKQLGAAMAVDPAALDETQGLQEFSADGVTCVFDCVGTSESMRLAARLVRKCGRIVMIGEEPQCAPVTSTEIAQRELEIIGSRNGTRQDMVEAINLLEKAVVKPVIAARFPLDDINHALDAMRRGVPGRIVVEIN
jgi:D-arabinose 1-dehydrogenase-like Zn-dependent alcohol dehydrogenase